MYHMKTTIMARMDTDTDVNAVIDYARHLAVQMDAKIVLFRSIYDPELLHKDVYALNEEEREQEAKAIKAARNELLLVATALQEVNIDVEVSVNWKSPLHTAFTQLTNRIKPVLIICGRSPSSLLGTTKNSDTDCELFELTDIPVLHVDRSPGQQPTNIVWAAVDPMPTQPESKTLNDMVIERAKNLAVATESELHLVHFHSSAMKMAEGSSEKTEQNPKGTTQMEVDDKHIAALLKLADRHTVERDKAHTFPSVTEAIMPILADGKRPDIVVTGADSEGLVTQFPTGTTARKLLNQLTGALCIVRLPHTRTKRDALAIVIQQARG